ncbi:MAG: hypothetical protein K0R24_571 [Gammaproteobacteria bacterium]|jgi:hypothetical protein|nr:hypothetical protein [Gammaproteobacteria bacterium]
MNRIIFSAFLGTILTIIFSSTCLAKTINLYEQPEPKAKIITTLDLDKPVAITIVAKEKEWTSIIDPTVAPKNARVVWIKTVDLPTNNYTFTQTTVNTGKGSQGYVVQYGVPKPLTPEQVAALTKQIQSQEEALASYFSQITQNIFKNISQPDMAYPFIIPVVVIPEHQPAVNPGGVVNGSQK